VSRRETLRRAHVAAELFNNEADPKPIHTIAHEFDISTRQAHRLVATARELGWIARTAPTGLVKNALVHGTMHGYLSHKCRCELCRAANTAAQTKLRKSRHTRGIPDGVKHGRYTTYNNWGCRCDDCYQAHRQKLITNRERRIQRKDQAPHGTVSGYDSWECRCDDCRRAACEYRRQWRAARRVSA
jgi:hypothetical protein